MKFKKPLMVAGAVSTIGLASVLGGGIANAATSSSTSGTGLVDKIASTFNLKKEDVQKVFDQDHTEREAEQTTQVTEDLTQLVTDGKITEAQKSAILAKRTEMQTQRDANRDAMDSKTDDERKAAMDAERTALDKWASDNGIDKTYLRYVFGGHGGHGNRGGPAPTSSDSSSSSSSSTGAN